MNICETNSPFFSIITPVYNREQCIAKAAKSITNQSFTLWEHIIVDDGSTDNTPELIDEIGKQDSRVNIIHLSCNQGVAAARNEGIQSATGKYLLFLDSDDEFLEDAFLTLYKILNEQEDIDAVIFPIVRFNETDFEEETKEQSISILQNQEIHERLLSGLLGVSPKENHHIFRPVLTNKCVKRCVFKDNDIRFDVSKLTWEDEEVCIKVIGGCKKICVLDKALMSDRTTDVNDHLSLKYYSDGVTNILSQYKWELDTFGDEFDFYSTYALDWHFKRIQTWIWRTLAKDKNSKKIVGEILRDPAFVRLIVRRNPRGVFEKAVRFFLMKKLYNFAYAVYSIQNRINRGQCY